MSMCDGVRVSGCVCKCVLVCAWCVCVDEGMHKCPYIEMSRDICIRVRRLSVLPRFHKLVDSIRGRGTFVGGDFYDQNVLRFRVVSGDVYTHCGCMCVCE